MFIFLRAKFIKPPLTLHRTKIIKSTFSNLNLSRDSFSSTFPSIPVPTRVFRLRYRLTCVTIYWYIIIINFKSRFSFRFSFTFTLKILSFRFSFTFTLKILSFRCFLPFIFRFFSPEPESVPPPLGVELEALENKTRDIRPTIPTRIIEIRTKYSLSPIKVTHLLRKSK